MENDKKSDGFVKTLTSTGTRRKISGKICLELFFKSPHEPGRTKGGQESFSSFASSALLLGIW